MQVYWNEVNPAFKLVEDRTETMVDHGAAYAKEQSARSAAIISQSVFICL